MVSFRNKINHCELSQGRRPGGDTEVIIWMNGYSRCTQNVQVSKGGREEIDGLIEGMIDVHAGERGRELVQ